MRGSKVRITSPNTGNATLMGHAEEYIVQYATNIHDDADEDEGETDGELSEVEDFDSDGEDEPAGTMEDV